MTTYIALLRGINVSGKNSIKMADLKELLQLQGYTDVLTYIQSGNIIFKSNKIKVKELETQISTAINKKYGYHVNVLIITKEELQTIFNSNPFLKNEAHEIAKLHVTLLNTEPDLTQLQKIETLVKSSDDEFIIMGKCVFLHCPNGYGKTKLNNSLFERKLKSPATTRNWKTITKLIELSNE